MEKADGNLHDADAETRRQAASAMGRAKTERKSAQSRINALNAANAKRGKPVSEETRALLSAKQQARRERERQEREAAAALLPPPEPKKMGRPRKEVQKEIQSVEADAPTRGRGRPKTKDAATMAETTASAENGTQEAGQA